MEEFLKHFKNHSRAEQLWLSQVFEAVQQQLFPLLDASRGLSVSGLSLSVVSKVQTAFSSLSSDLPVSYRFVSVSELIRDQRTACCSSLSWSSAHYREQARGAELKLPAHKAIPRDNLLLIGCLCDGRAVGTSEGVWRVRDAGGSLACAMLKSSSLWLGRLMLFPSWNYIPHDAPGLGYLELLEPPVCVTLEAMAFDPGGALSEVMSVMRAAELLRQRCGDQVCVCVSGQVSVVCPLLVIRGKRFFCLVLSEEGSSVPVFITEAKHQYWRQCVCVGRSVCISSLRVCSLQGMQGQRVLTDSCQSRLHPHLQNRENSEDPDTHSVTDDTHSADTHSADTHSADTHSSDTHSADTHSADTHSADTHSADTHTDSINDDTHSADTHSADTHSADTHSADTHSSDTHSADTHSADTHSADTHTDSINDDTLPADTHSADTHSADTHTDSVTADTHSTDAVFRSGSAVRVKRSKLISFKGTVTKILNAEAGLYEIDGQVGLCLAYQPAQKWGGGLRPGAEIQLHNVHFIYRSSPFAPSVVLCACLRSSLQITSFSRLRSKVEVSGSHGPLQRLLLEKNLGPSQYLWLCYCQDAVAERLCPRWVRAERVCVVAERLLDVVCDPEHKTQKKRDIYREMIQKPHQCPVTMFCVWWPSTALWSLKQLSDWMRHEVWSSLSLASLLPPSAAHMTALELNSALSWSVHTVQLTDVAPEPLLLLGVLELDPTRATLQLRDQTHTLDCLCVSEDRTAHISTAWQGCLVCVQRCTLVMERFMKSQFPSWKHLDQPSYITHKDCRLYLQLCVDDLIIISPSAAMSRCLMEDRQAGRASAKRPPTPVACVSVLLRLEWKQAVLLRPEPGFVCGAVCLGDAQRWSHDPKNTRPLERERLGDAQQIELHFTGSCVRWFPVLHPGCVYRLIARNTEDVSLLKAKGVLARGGVTQLSSPALLLQPQWRIHTITEELPDTQSGVPEFLSVSEVLLSSSAPEIVSFRGVITQRITLQEDSGSRPRIQSQTAAEEQDVRLRLTVRDAERPGHVIDVYVDLSWGPYTLGLIPGAALSVRHVQRKLSKVCNVYCRSLPVSCVCVTDLTSVCSRSGVAPPLPPMMLLGEWAASRTQRCVLAQVKGHVVCVLSLRLQWTCSLCGSIFGQASCGRTHPPCDSTSAVFQAEAKVVLEDGSADAHVWFSSDSVCDLLKLNAGQWEGLQRHVKVKGHVKVYTRGRSMTCDEDPDDVLVQYLSCLCSSAAVCRQIHLTCRLRAQRTGKSQLKKVHRGQTEFICKFPPALQLQCTHIHTHTSTVSHTC
ncbi:CST complex subunit CTC1 [Puntigrus tetrazona]|uniref:CST complex subunit CTC1 n=1 Tax=Puntigrus tetrazona TaxID=1606681 RepID=UPI001C892EDE|nr:CST complex subunit CTC1 [Puntigrus tetrazona]